MLLGAAPGTTAFSAATSTYDVPTIERVDAHQIEAAATGPTLLGDAREESASPAAKDQRTATTPASQSVATEAAIDTTDALQSDRSFDAANSYHGRAGSGKVSDLAEQ
ncbi:MAG: hypothetical protein WCC60_05285 [Ilumatobacteraceae bacterium]